MSTVTVPRAGLRVMSLADYEQVAAARQEFVDFLLGTAGLPAVAKEAPGTKTAAW